MRTGNQPQAHGRLARGRRSTAHRPASCGPVSLPRLPGEAGGTSGQA